MKRYRVKLHAIFAIAAVAVGLLAAPPASAAPQTSAPSATTTACAKAPFKDVTKADTFCADITWLVNQGVTKGYPDGGFHPGEPVTRQAMAAFLHRLTEPGEKNTACTVAPFKDVKKTDTFCTDITWLVDRGVTKGYPDGGFHPGEPVTRQAMAAFLHRLTEPNTKNTKCSAAPFKDVTKADTFCADITWLVDRGVTKGYPDGGFHPGEPVTRQAMAAFLHRLTEPAADTGQSAIRQLLETLPVKGRAPKTGYDRALFGPTWTDNVTVAAGRNGCDTRNDILRRDLTNIVIKQGSNGCTVETGILADPYTGATIQFTRGAGTSTAVQIDHVVALSDAWQKGAQQLSNLERTNFANDPVNLLAVDGPTNAKKSDGDAATWLPPRKAYRCTYVALQVTVKAKYRLWVTKAEHDAIANILDGCGNVTLPNMTPPGLVKEKPPQPDPGTVGCRPLSNAGNCYQPGQICRAADRGTSGIDNNGKAIKCTNQNGTWRWAAS